MSYLLFSQTSTANGTRNLWNSADPGDGTSTTTASINHAVIGGTLLGDIANSTFDEAALVATLTAAEGYDLFGTGYAIDVNKKAYYDLSDAVSGGGYDFNAQLATQLAAGGNVLAATAANTAGANDRTLTDGSGYDSGAKTLSLALNDVNWNDIKNVEVVLASAETGSAYTKLSLQAFVDARVKIGDTDFGACFSLKEALSPDTRMAVEILDGKRGQVDGSESDLALDVTIDVWTNNGGWQNSFANQGSNFNDTFDINFGSLAVVKGVSEFGLGAGTLVDASDASFGTDTDQTSAYNGQLTTLLTNLGRGEDRYDATTGVGVVASGGGTEMVAAELRTTDWVWGGSGNDTINAGGGNDFLFGDFGSAMSGLQTIGQSADTNALSLKVGGTGDPRAWVDGTGVTLTAFNASSGITTTFGQSDIVNDVKRAVLDTNLVIKDKPGGASGVQTVANGPLHPSDEAVFEQETPLNATAAPLAYGLGVDDFLDDENNDGDDDNSEINSGPTDTMSDPSPTTAETLGTSDTLTLDLGQLASSFKGTLSMFYGNEVSVGGDTPTETTWGAETAIVRLGRDANGNGVIDGAEEVGAIRFSSVSTDDAVATSGIVTGFSGQAVDAALAAVMAQGYANSNPGLFDFSIATSGIFDLIEFSSGGYLQATTSKTGTFDSTVTFAPELDGSSDVSDFLLREICFTSAGLEGNDVLNAGSGRDMLVGGGDFATVVTCADDADEVIKNGGFETLATDAAQQEGGAWYLTAGVPAAGAGFAWKAAPTTLIFDDIALPPGAFAEARIANGYGGFDWLQAGVFRAAPVELGGYTASSGTQIGFIAEAAGSEVPGYGDAMAGTPLTFSRSTPFDFVSATFSAAFRDDVQITATAFDAANVAIGTKVFEADMDTATLVDFTTAITGSFTGAVKITLNANDGNDATSDYFGVDDLTFRGSNIEIQKGGTGGLSLFAGTYKLELDSDPLAAANPLVMQDFVTCDGAFYTARFAFAERQGGGDGSSDFQLFWEGKLVATFTNPAGPDTWTMADADAGDGITVAIAEDGAAGGWWTATVNGLKGDGADSLGFQALASQTNTHGTFIDQVSLKATHDSYKVDGGDRLYLGGADAARDTVVFEAGDGFDLVYGYDRSATGTSNDDVIDLNGVTVSSGAAAVVNGDLGWLLDLSDGGRMFLAGVTNGADILFAV